MPDYTHPTLTLHGHHVPEEHRTVNTDGTVEVVQLPGVFQIWAEIEGQHKQLMRQAALTKRTASHAPAAHPAGKAHLHRARRFALQTILKAQFGGRAATGG